MPEHETEIPETAAAERAATVEHSPGDATATAVPAPAASGHERVAAATAAPTASPQTLVASYDDDQAAYGPDDGWDEPIEELPRRPRRRLLGKGSNPIALALLGVLLIACGFIGGALVEKSQNSSGSSAAGGGSGLAARFAALRGGASAGAGSSTAGAATVRSAGGLFGGGSTGAGTGFTRPTAGTVAYLAGSTLYVTNSEDNTVKVKTSAGTTVTKTVTSSVKDIHPGETVTVTGATGADGAVTAESISAGSSGGGLAALFGAAGAGTGAGSTTSSRGQSGAAGAGGATDGGPALFGNGG
jgi:hypothetical protein